jgi:hypothetical protein
MAVCQLIGKCLTRRHREQARSHKGLLLNRMPVMKADPM